MKRRDLTKGQKAMVLTKGLEAERRRAKERQQQAGGDRKSEDYKEHKSLRANLPELIEEQPRPRDILAAAAGVSPRTAQDVITVVDSKDADLIAEVKEGRMAPYKAAAEVRERQKFERTKSTQ